MKAFEQNDYQMDDEKQDYQCILHALKGNLVSKYAVEQIEAPELNA
jgi:hypothetical protein